MSFRNALRHLHLVRKHRRLVLRHCAKCGILWRGLVHDLSKFSPTEFFESAKFYQGNRSPIGACRRAQGVSYAWLHHKAHNKHHPEYWCDDDCAEHPMMPYVYAVECVCDKLAATKAYNGENFEPTKPLWHWETYGSKVRANEKTKSFIKKVLSDYAALGEDAVLNREYMKRTYSEICK